MKKIRFFFNLAREYLKKRYRLIILGIFLGIIFFLFIPNFWQKVPFFSKTKKIGVVGKYTLEEIPDEIQSLMSQGLTKISGDDEVIPALAESFEVKSEGKEYVFKLKKDIKWTDGKPFVAKDVNYNFKDVQIKIDNDYQITFVLKDPFAPFPLAVSKPIFRKGLIGLGNYRIKKIQFNGQFVESIFLIPLDFPSHQNLIFKFYPTEDASKIALKLGEITNLNDILSVDGIENFANLKIESKTKFDRLVGLFFNTEKPYLEDKLFRQALAYAIKKDRYSHRALVSISPENWAYFEDVKPYDYDLNKAKSLLQNSLNKTEPSEIKLTIVTVPQLLNQAEAIRKDWQELGIKVELGPFKPGETDFQVILAVQEMPSDPDQYSLWHSTSSNNITNLKSLRIDKLLEDGRINLNQEERKKIYFDFQKYLVEEAPVVFLYYPDVFSVTRK